MGLPDASPSRSGPSSSALSVLAKAKDSSTIALQGLLPGTSPSSPAMPKPNPRAASSSAAAAAAASSPDAVRKEREENTVPTVYDASADIEDDYRLFLENVLVYENEDFVLEYEGKVVRYGGDEAISAGGGSRGEDPVMEEEKEKEKEVDVVVISSSSDDESTKIVSEPNPLDRGVFQRKMKKVVDKEKMDEKNEAAAPLVKGKGVGKVSSHDPGSGIIWPPHIMHREEPSFKQGLIKALSKPFCPREYDKLYGMATVREPSMRELRTRSGSKIYYSNSWMGKSYLDVTLDLAEQMKETSYHNRLALLRGLFCWLQNVERENQFKPWTKQNKRYKVIHFKERTKNMDQQQSFSSYASR
ncbi:uncharacterized protein LOC127770209 [Oryza glaberrima]|uniref:uncharacterized protein LOC127770209 n=1 Tax=Oryza glaberrima TaxID=4538 RepID=UPI00224C4B47|nr:uncharacterized protein LOC127770209 [Oryza glaberrima]